MRQVTVGNLLEARFGSGAAGNVLKGINDAFMEGKNDNPMNHLNAAVKKSILDESGIVNGFYVPVG